MSAYRDVVTSHLKEDSRIFASLLAMRRVYQSPLYEIYLCVFSGLINSPKLHRDLVTCMVVFRKESLRIMFKLWTDEIDGDRNEYLATVVRRLEKEKTQPLKLVKNAKTWASVPFTEEDLRNLIGIS